jgi:hypothetical protein
MFTFSSQPKNKRKLRAKKLKEAEDQTFQAFTETDKRAKTLFVKDFPSVKDFFEEYILARPDYQGYVMLSKSAFVDMCDSAQNPEDIDAIIESLPDFIGHRNVFKSEIIEKLIWKALDLNCSDKIYSILTLHRELTFFPSTEVIAKCFEAASSQEYEAGLKPFFNAVRNRVFLEKPAGFWKTVI